MEIMTFEEFWKSIPRDMGPKGSKFEANKEWDKLKPDTDLCKVIAEYMVQKADIDRQKRNQGVFVANWKHTVRLLKQRFWMDELELPKYKREPGAMKNCNDCHSKAVDHAGYGICWACYDNRYGNSFCGHVV